MSGDRENPPAETASPHDDPSLLRAILEATASGSGETLLRGVVRQAAAVIGTRYGLLAERLTPDRARVLASSGSDRIAEGDEWDLGGTPCEAPARGETCLHASGVRDRFPSDARLAPLSVESYLGLPLPDPSGEVLGHLALLHDLPLAVEPGRIEILRWLATRAAIELAHMREGRELAGKVQLYRDLYEEAPIPYIYEDLESRFVSANRAACRMLGIRPEEVTETYGKDLLAPTPENMQRVERALQAMKTEGTEFSWVELELRRKHSGEPIWIRWWSKPDPDGLHTRTMAIDITEQVLMVREKNRLEEQNIYLQEEIKLNHNFEEIVGRSSSLLRVLDDVSRVASTDASVLITGETGTGKELIARAIHSNSRRRERPLIKINCAALPAGLVESELFGHERGAFSGAIARRIGRFELANGGTIFLDEIGEIPAETQVKLLRVLQEREFERVGGSTPIRTDVRVITATNRDLKRAVTEGTFREDLFYRLNVFPIHLPPLRERAGDIPMLVRFIVDRFAQRVGKKIVSIPEATMRRLAAYAWPGNVREMENILERAVILARGDTIEIGPELLPDPVPARVRSADAESAPAGLKSVERRHILAALEKANWVIEGERGAARILEMHPNTLRSRMKKLQIRRPGTGGTGVST